MGFFKSNRADYVIWDDQYHFIPNSDIVKVTIKNHTIFNKKVKSVSIKTSDNTIHRLSITLNEPLLPYHKDNFEQFMRMYGK